MKKIRHVHADSNEWVRVHRSSAPASSGGGSDSDWWVTALGILVAVVGGIYVLIWIVEVLFPTLALIGVLCFGVK